MVSRNRAEERSRALSGGRGARNSQGAVGVPAAVAAVPKVGGAGGGLGAERPLGPRGAVRRRGGSYGLGIAAASRVGAEASRGGILLLP